MEPKKEPYSLSVRLLLLVASGLSFLIYLFVYRLFRYRYDVTIDNLSKSFPGKNRGQIEEYAQEYYRHLGDLVVEPLLFMLVDSATRKKLAHYTHTEVLEKFYRNGDNVVALASHCGNWEYLINLPKVLKFETYTAYTPLSNKRLDHYILKLRSMYGVILIVKRHFFRGALAVLKKRESTSMVVVIADQRPAPGSGKHFVQFLAQPTLVQIGAERLATASGAAVVFLECVKTARFHYNYTFRVVTDDAERCLPMEITDAYYEMLEENIRKSPSHWLWSHNRWKPMPQSQVEVLST